MSVSRREFVACGVYGALLLGRPFHFVAPDPAQLTARPKRPSGTLEPGLRKLSLGSPRDALVYVPASRDPKTPSPLILALHGATQDAAFINERLTVMADLLGAVLLSPDSRGVTWDAIRGDFGPDVRFIDRALTWTFDRAVIDPARMTLAGFSDGASYGLSLGIANGDVFGRIVAFSPGFVIETTRRGTPAIFVSHGRRDQILPIDRASRRIVPELKAAGYSVRFDEFDGGHGVPPEMARAAAEWVKHT